MVRNLSILISLLAVLFLPVTAQQVQLTLPPASPEAHSYSQLRWALYFVDVLWTAGAILLLLQSGFAKNAQDLFQARLKHWALRVCAYTVAIALAYYALRFPLVFFASFWVEHQYQLSDQSFPLWLTNYLKSRLVELAIGMPIALGAYFVVSRFKHWSLILWSALVPVVFLIVFIYPLLVDPLFNKYEPLLAGRLHDQLSALESKAGISGSPIFIVDKSRQTKKANAFVTGLGSSARIVIWDTSLTTLNDEEVSGVVAHEIGHYVLHHIFLSVTIICGGLLVVLLAMERYEQPLITSLPKRWNVHGKTDLTVIPAAFFFFVIFGFVLDPFANAYSRYIENEADLYSLKLMNSGTPMASALLKFARGNMSDPDPPPLVEFWLFDHPALRRRFDQAMSWKSTEESK